MFNLIKTISLKEPAYLNMIKASEISDGLRFEAIFFNDYAALR